MENTNTIKSLVVENDEIQRHLLVDIMEFFGYRLGLAATGRVAVEKLAAEQYDAMLVSIDLADMPAIQVVQQAKQLVPLIAVIVVTTTDNHRIRMLTQECVDKDCVDGTLIRPYAVTAVREIILSTVRAKRRAVRESHSESRRTLYLHDSGGIGVTRDLPSRSIYLKNMKSE